MLNGESAELIQCPYCFEWITIIVDCSVSEQQYIEDCQVCCRPIEILARVGPDGHVDVTALHENE